MDNDYELLDDHYSAPLPSDKTDNRSKAVESVLSNLESISVDDLDELRKCINLINRRKWIKNHGITSSLYNAYSYSLRLHILYRLFALLKYRSISALTMNVLALISSLL